MRYKYNFFTFALFLMFMLSLTMVSAFSWETDLSNNLKGYWSFDTVDGYNQIGYTTNAYNGSALVNKSNTGKINNSWSVDYNNNILAQQNNYTSWDLTGKPFTANFWTREDSDCVSGCNTNHISIDNTNLLNYLDDLSGGTENFILGGTTFYTRSSTQNPVGTWYMITVTYDGSTARAYKNGASIGSGAVSASTASFNLSKGFTFSGTGSTKESIDEVGIWNRVLNSSDISYLYNSGNGLFNPYISSPQLQVNLNAPANNTQFISQIEFSSNLIISIGNLTNATLYIWNSTGVYNKDTDYSSGQFNGVNSWVRNESIYKKMYNQSLSECAWINIKNLANDAHIISAPYGSTAGGRSGSLMYNSAGIVEFYIRNETGSGVYVNKSGLTANNWYFVCGVYDKNTAVVYINGINGTPVNIYGGLVNSTASTIIGAQSNGVNPNAWYHNGSISDVRIYNTSLSSSQISTLYNQGRDGNIGSVNSGLVAFYPLHQDTLDYSGNGNNGVNTNVTFWGSSITNIWNKTISTIGTYTWNVLGCSLSGCSWGNSNRTFVYGLVNNGETWNNLTTEGSLEVFQLNLTLVPEARLTTGYLMYNGTSYLASIIANGNTYLLRSLAIPQISTTVINSFFWLVNFDTGFQYNTTAQEQTVQNLGIDNCSSYTNQLFNLIMYDEDTQGLLVNPNSSTSIKVDYTISTISGTVLATFNKSFNSVNPARVCLQNVLNNSVYRLDGLIEYSSVGRFQEYYHFQNYSLTSATTGLNINLYNLNTSTGQEFKITYKDSNFVPVSGALFNIQRKYVDEGVFKTTEFPKTGTEGYTIGHLVRNDAVYNIIVVKNGKVLATFTDIVADCQNPLLQSCQINLNSYGSSILPPSFSNVNDMVFTLTYNKTTRLVQSIYTIPSGIPSTITLNVTLFDRLGTTNICTDSLYSAGGQLSCSVSTSFGNSTILAKLYKDGALVGQGVMDLAEKPAQLYGKNLMFIAFLILFVFLGFAVTSDSPMIAGVIMALGMIVLVSMNIIYSPSFVGVGATVLWFIIAIILILVHGSNRQ